MKQANTYKNIYFFNPAEKGMEQMQSTKAVMEMEEVRMEEIKTTYSFQNSNIISMREVFEKGKKFQNLLRKLEWFKKSTRSLKSI